LFLFFYCNFIFNELHFDKIIVKAQGQFVNYHLAIDNRFQIQIEADTPFA